jgi:hypothetical protein
VEGVAKRDGQRVRRVRPDRVRARKLHPHHVVDLPLVRVARADDGLLDGVRRVFRDRDTGGRRHQHRNAPRLPELQCASPVAVDEGHLDRRGLRRMAGHNRGQLHVERQEALRQGVTLRPADAVGHVAQPAAVDIDDTPAEAPQARIDSDDAHALPRSRLPAACRCIPSARFKDRADRRHPR